jgi:phenylacetate-CoA ligase
METASIDALRQHQLERLRWSPSTPTRTCRCTASASMPGAHPDDLQFLEDLAKFPFTGKNDLRDNYPYGMFAVPMQDMVRLHASSGTTGKPTVVGYTQNDIDTANVVARSIPRRRRARGDKVHVSYGYGLFTGGLGAHYGAERLGCTVIPMSGGQTEKQVQLIRDFQPDIIMVTPSYMLNLADEIERQGIDPHNLALRLASSVPSPGPPNCAPSSSAGHHALDIYGLSEIMGPGVPWNASRPRTARPSGKTTSTRDHRPVTGEAAGRPAGRAGVHLAEQGSAADDPLPHPRPHAPAAGHRKADAAHRQDHRAQRRHADHPRGQRVPDADRRHRC